MSTNPPREFNPSARPDALAQHRRTVRGLEDLIDSMVAVDWSDVPLIDTAEVAQFSGRLSDSMDSLQSELEEMKEESA